eukprot:183282_1
MDTRVIMLLTALVFGLIWINYYWIFYVGSTITTIQSYIVSPNTTQHNAEHIPFYNISYIQSLLDNNKNTKCLNEILPIKLQFIHIPKTAGYSIAIETAAFHKYRICWGQYMFRDWLFANYSKNSAKRKYPMFTINTIYGTYTTVLWHIPLKHLIKYISNNVLYNGSMSLEIMSYINLNHQFCIVRNPFSKIVSEYQQLPSLPGPIHDLWIKNFSKIQCSANALNFWVKHILMDNNPYCMRGCHFIPQYEFIFDENNKQMCKNVLKFENLSAEFNTLLDKYHLAHLISLNGIHKNHGKKCENLTVNELSNESKQIVRQKYKIDFDAFQYKMYY